MARHRRVAGRFAKGGEKYLESFIMRAKIEKCGNHGNPPCRSPAIAKLSGAGRVRRSAPDRSLFRGAGGGMRKCHAPRASARPPPLAERSPCGSPPRGSRALAQCEFVRIEAPVQEAKAPGRCMESGHRPHRRSPDCMPG